MSFLRRHRHTLFAALLAAACLLGLAIGGAALAQEQNVTAGELLPEEVGTTIGTGTADIRITIARIIRAAFGFLGIIAVLLILYAGFLWMTAAGNQDRITKAKQTMSAAVIGLVIVLSAFAIASFIISSLVRATTGIEGAPAGGGGPGGGGFGGGAGGAFRPTAIQPKGSLAKYDVTASVTFSAAPTGDVSNIKANLSLEKVSGESRTPVEYDPIVQNRTIKLVPTTPCPAPNETRRCLEPNADYAVTVKNGLKNADTLTPRTVNCGFNAVCSQTFKTGDAVATQPPTAAISSPTDGQSAPAGDLITVQSILTDQNGIANVDYAADGAFFAADGSAASIAPSTYSSQAGWDTAAYTPVKTVSLTAKVTNIDGDEAASAAVRVVLRPAHCFNGTRDVDETGPDCGGSDCGTCTGGGCTAATACASGECVGGQCVESPKITDVQLPDGKPGNLVTITGLHFGSVAGKVTFLGAAEEGDEVDAALGSCTDAWSDGRAVVVVPEGAKTGPIRLRTAGGKTDATNDAFGPIISDFIVNDVARPGICSISPVSAKVGRALTVTGAGFGAVQGGSRIHFARAGSDCLPVQPWSEAADAGEVSPWSEISVQPNVPNVTTGVNGTNYLVRAAVGGQPSNPVCMRVEPPEAGTEPRIEYLAPEKGSVGTYLTIFGENLGTSGKVRFVSGAGTAFGDITFPKQCAVGFWKNTSVTVKVPKTFTIPSGDALDIGVYNVSVLRSDGRASNVKAFTVNTDPLKPGACKIDPDNGPEGLGVKIYGEGFGKIPAESLNALKTAHPDAVRFFDQKNISTLGLWENTEIATAAPKGATSGPVVVRKYSGDDFVESNGVNFKVQDCREKGGDAACETGQKCCVNGSCGSDCAAPEAGAFAWQFSTGPIPVFPVVLEDATCQLPPSGSPPPDTITPSPNPFKGAKDVCSDIGAITLRFSLPMQPALMTSQNVLLERCDGEETIGADCTTVATGAPALIMYEEVENRMLTIPLLGGIQPSKWHRLTIKDAVMSTDALPERSAQPLDGNFDRKAGGDYVTTFKTAATPCTLAAVDVQPASGLIDDSQETLDYLAQPLSDRCIVLQCSTRTVAWTSSDAAKAAVDPTGGINACQTEASPVSETEPGPPVEIRATIDSKQDTGLLRIDYTNPRVVKFGPNCQEACVNAAAFAVFNTPMAESGPGSVLANAVLIRCDNESCLNAVPEIALNPSYNESSKMLILETDGGASLAADTFYRVIINGTAASTSGAPLTGLNYNNQDFSWIFRTRKSATPCGPQKISIDPRQTTLHFIGELGEVTALPYTSPDKCSPDGQLLMSSSLNWNWSKQQNVPDPERFTLLPDFPTILATTPDLPDGCSTSCLFTGSRPAGTASCGNGAVEYGEACDDGDAASGDGCSSKCLFEGNTVANGCGDGAVSRDKGEECDLGNDASGAALNGKAGSGCSAACLLTGSISGVSACGNGSTGAGEACDDENRRNGDGCSSSCRWEGSEAGAAVCGNGALEFGEQCDYVVNAAGTSAAELLVPGLDPISLSGTGKTDPRKSDFPCGSSCLLRGNPAACVSGLNCCGNGVIEHVNGEGCDAGPQNGQAGSGCSAICTKSGSDPYLGAFCGDGDIIVKPEAGGIAGGGGEECEGTPDGKFDPLQVIKAKNQCDAKNSCVGRVTAAVGSVSGQGNVNVECSCRFDSDCSAFGTNLSCGAGACCYPRPELPAIEPTGGNECRNAQISVTFPELMSEGSLQGNIFVKKCAGPVAAEAPKNWFARALQAVGSFFKSLLGRKASAQTCEPIQGSFAHSVIISPDGASSFTRSTFTPNEILSATTTYEVSVVGGPTGAKTAQGVGYTANPAKVQTFTTGSEICKLDVVEVAPASIMISSSSTVYGLSATPKTDRDGLLEPIAPAPGFYDWEWSWNAAPDPASPADLLDLKPAAPPALAATVQAKKGQNGRAQAAATATITNNSGFPEVASGTQIIGASDVRVFLCENPWPRRDPSTGTWEPYVDPETHFEFFYCRDNPQGVLPELQSSPVQGQSAGISGLARFCKETMEDDQPKACQNNFDCDPGDVCRSKDLLFQFLPEWKLRDALGIRVFDNPNRLDPQAWYEEQKFSGSTQPLTVDGYQAIKDQRTLYVAAADKYGDPDLRVRTYVFAGSDRADTRVTAVFDQLAKNLRFNTNMAAPGQVVNVCKNGAKDLVLKDGAPVSCASDLDCYRAIAPPPAGLFCDAPVAKIHRDMRRWQDLQAITEALENIKQTTGSYPKVESGSFLRGLTTSKWPSWSQQLGAAGVAVDPLNAYAQCADFGSECSITRKACASNAECDQSVSGDVCQPKYDNATCFNNRDGLYLCPAGSHVYQYFAKGGEDYRLAADFEFTDFPWAERCESITAEFLCGLRTGCRWVVDETGESCRGRFTIEPVCRGVPGNNICLKTGLPCAESADCGADDSCQPADAALFGSAVGGSCGNGVVEGDEECEIGNEREVACPGPAEGGAGGKKKERCGGACRWEEVQACPDAPVCGDGSIEFDRGETCDDGPLTGQYGRCRVGELGCVKRCVNITKRAANDFDADRDIKDVCSSNADCADLPFPSICTDRHAFCGDGRKTSLESCDDGTLNGQYGKCAWDCRGPGPRCGDNLTNGEEACDGNQETSTGVCVPSDFTLDDGATFDGAAVGCTKDADCGGDLKCALCQPTATAIPQNRAKSCNTTGLNACTFNNWSQCKPTGSCGNGVTEGAEECDAGSANSVNGSCLPNCQQNVCNDGYWQTGVEQCDNGASNGVKCTPNYGFTCNYCRNNCTIETISGAFCGDRQIIIGSESCDPGPVSAWCSRTYRNLAQPEAGACLLPLKTEFSDTALQGSNTACTRDSLCPSGEVCVLKVGKCAKACTKATEDSSCGVDGTCKALITACETNIDCKPGICKNYPGAAFRPASVCGNGACELDETAQSCAADCARPVVCGDKICDAGENNANCSADCRAPNCGDGICDSPVEKHTCDSLDSACQEAPGVECLDDCGSGPIGYSPPNRRFAGTGPGGVLEFKMPVLSRITAELASVAFRAGFLSPLGLQPVLAYAPVRLAAAPPGDSSSSDVTVGVTLLTPPDTSSPKTFVHPAGIGSLPAEGTVCWSTKDCAPTQYCEGTEGECLAYGGSCTQDPYTNVAVPSSPRTYDGSCNSCTSSCIGSTKTPGPYCGDLVVQGEYGEECDGNPDPDAIGKGTQYGCNADCTGFGGFCGDGIVQADRGEVCDVNLGSSRVDNGVIVGKILDAAFAQGISEDGSTTPGIPIELWEGTSKIADTRTNAFGEYQFTGLNLANSCKAQKYAIKIPALTGTYSNNKSDSTGSTPTTVDDKITYTTLGYFAKTVPETDGFGFSCGAASPEVKSITRDRIEMEDVFLVPKLKTNEYLILVEWEGSLNTNYLDLHLRRPDGVATHQGTYYGSPGNQNLDTKPPNSFLYCYHTDGSSSCGSFDTRPQTMKFKWANDAGTPFYASGKFRAWVTDYKCATLGNAGTKSSCNNFTTKKIKVQLYNKDGLFRTFNTPTPRRGMTSTGGYWELFSLGFNNAYTNINQRSSTLPDNTESFGGTDTTI